MARQLLSADQRQALAEALLLWRYVGHMDTGAAKLSLVPDTASETRAYLALDLAKRIGVKTEYLRVLWATDVLSVSVRNLDRLPTASRKGVGGRRKKVRP